MNIKLQSQSLFRVLPLPVWLVLLWAVLFLTNAGLREVYWEEGSRGLQARSMLEDGHWLVPEPAGRRYVTKPPMLPWLMAGGSFFTGGLNEWAVRLPSLLATLAAGLAAFLFVRRIVSERGAVFAALAFFLSPMIFEKGALGETDTLVMCCSFVAFVLWWCRYSDKSRVGLSTWFGCGMILALGVMAKGPPAALYFTVAVLVLMLRDHRWRDLPGYAVCLAVMFAPLVAWVLVISETGDSELWRQQMMRGDVIHLGHYVKERLEFLVAVPVAALPWLAVALPAFVPRWRRRFGVDLPASRAMLLYILAGTAVMFFVPDVRPRYVLPIFPAVAVSAGLVFDRLPVISPRAIRLIVVLTTLMFTVRLLYLGVALPLSVNNHLDARHTAAEVSRILGDSGESDAPIYMLSESLSNTAFYFDRAPIETSAGELAESLPSGTAADVVVPLSKLQSLREDSSSLEFKRLGRIPRDGKDTLLVGYIRVVPRESVVR